MTVFITIETSQPCGKSFRLVLGASLSSALVTVVLRLVGLV